MDFPQGAQADRESQSVPDRKTDRTPLYERSCYSNSSFGSSSPDFGSTWAVVVRAGGAVAQIDNVSLVELGNDWALLFPLGSGFPACNGAAGSFGSLGR